jgi:hypothetical protein
MVVEPDAVYAQCLTCLACVTLERFRNEPAR